MTTILLIQLKLLPVEISHLWPSCTITNLGLANNVGKGFSLDYWLEYFRYNVLNWNDAKVTLH